MATANINETHAPERRAVQRTLTTSCSDNTRCTPALQHCVRANGGSMRSNNGCRTRADCEGRPTVMEEFMLRIAIIIGSTRPGRKSEAVAKWAYEIAQKRSDAEFELVDIEDFNLPLLDEPMPPSMGQYTHDHTKRWSEKIASFDGYVQ